MYQAFHLQMVLENVGPAAVPALINVLLAPDSKLRSFAARVLGEIGDVSAVQPLCDVLADPAADWELASACATALGEIGDRSAVFALIAATHANGLEDRTVIGPAVEALGKIGDRAAIPTLLLMLEGRRGQFADVDIEEDWGAEDERNSAAEALGMLADPATLPALEDALKDAQGKLKHDIERAIRRIQTVNE